MWQALNERSGTVLNRTQYPSDVIALVMLWRLRYKLALRDLPEMFAVRGIVFSYEPGFPSAPRRRVSPVEEGSTQRVVG